MKKNYTNSDRIILHCDLNGFYASVECLLDPSLKDIPMAVCGDPTQRHGIILAKNELAKQYGVITAETVWQARKKCPKLKLVPPHHNEYLKYSKRTNDIYKRYTDLVETFGIDESWLDVTGSIKLFGDGKAIADSIRKTVREELGLTVSVGVSFNKVFAKLGSDYKKPDATTVISRDVYKEMVFPLPVNSLLYVGKSANHILAQLGIKTIGQLAYSDRNILTAKLGKMGGQIYDYANGNENSPVELASHKMEAKSIGNGTTFSHDITTFEEIKAGIMILCDSIGSRMRRKNLKCKTIQVAIKDPAFKVINRQKQLERPTNLTREITDTAIEIMKEKWSIGKPIRALTVTANQLIGINEECEQLTLQDTHHHEKQEKIEKTIDAIRNKYGQDTIAFGLKPDKGGERG